MNAIRRFFQQAFLYYKEQYIHFSFGEILGFKMFLPVFILLYYCMAARYGFNAPPLTRWVIGNSFLLCTYQCLFSLGYTFSSERYGGRLRTLIVAPRHKLVIAAEKSFFMIFEGLVTSAFGLLCGSLIFGISFAGVNMLLFVTVLLSGMIAAMGFGLFLSAFGLISDSLPFVLNVVYAAMLILCGANFPIGDLPAPARILSYMLPLTRSIEGANMLFGSVDTGRFLSLVAQELGVGAIYAVLGYVTLKICEKVAIKRAAFEMF